MCIHTLYRDTGTQNSLCRILLCTQATKDIPTLKFATVGKEYQSVTHAQLSIPTSTHMVRQGGSLRIKLTMQEAKGLMFTGKSVLQLAIN